MSPGTRDVEGGPAWVWLFPASYAVHVAEEAAGGFPRWFSQTFQADLGTDRFWSTTSVGLVLFCVLAGLVHLGGPLRGLLTVLAAITLGNGASHCVFSALTRTYSPGTVSGAVLWIPLGLFGLVWAWKRVSRVSVVAGALAGTAILLGVFRMALGR